MNKPTYQDLKQYHYDLWNWLVENPESEKSDWPEWEKLKKENPTDNPLDFAIKRYCFACQACLGKCEECPLISSEFRDFGHSLAYSTLESICCDGLYRAYNYSYRDVPERIRLATLIRDKWEIIENE